MDKELPLIGEIVVVKVTKVLGYGVFVELLEYDDLKGFIHISQVASRWVKNIRNYVKENQIRAAAVLSIKAEREQIDLSLNKVSAGAQRKKIEEWKQFKREQKLIEVLASENKKSFDDTWNEVAEPLIEENKSLMKSFQEISLSKEISPSVPKKWHKSLLKLIEKNVVVPEKVVKSVLQLTSTASDGVEIIKKTLNEIEKQGSNEARIDLYYLGSGKYMVKVISYDYKLGEKTLKEAIEKGIKFIELNQGEGILLKDEAQLKR